MIHPRRGTTVLMLAHLSFDLPVPRPAPSLPPGADLPRKQWVRLNRLRSGTARVGENLQLWGMQEAASCPCGHPDPDRGARGDWLCLAQVARGPHCSSLSERRITRSWLSELPIELWFLIISLLFDKRLYILEKTFDLIRRLFNLCELDLGKVDCIYIIYLFILIFFMCQKYPLTLNAHLKRQRFACGQMGKNWNRTVIIQNMSGGTFRLTMSWEGTHCVWTNLPSQTIV